MQRLEASGHTAVDTAVADFDHDTAQKGLVFVDKKKTSTLARRALLEKRYDLVIINAPLSDNDYYAIDESIPFYEMLIHGCIDYSGSVINLGNTTDENEIILTLIENGASPHFVFTKSESNEMKKTALNKFYSTTFDSWKDSAVKIWKETNTALSKVSGASITGHRNISEGVSVTVYSNGVTIYVNHTDESVNVDGVEIDAKSYVIGG